jgi:hypothetical protein
VKESSIAFRQVPLGEVSGEVFTIMQRLPGETLPATEVEWGGEPRQRPPPRQFVLALPIRDPERFLRQHCADAA